MPLKIAKVCAVPGCGRTQSLHILPSEPNIRNAWLKFVYNEIPACVGKSFSVCSLHFTAESFANKSQVYAGFAVRLRLTNNAVPTILDPTETAHQSNVPTKQDVACQTDTPTRTPRFTQLSLGTLGPKFRSKGTQTEASVKSVGVSPTTSGETYQPFVLPHLTSTPLKDFRPTKRARLELEGEETDSFEVTDQQDTTCEPAESVTTVTESSQLQCTSVYFNGGSLFQLQKVGKDLPLLAPRQSSLTKTKSTQTPERIQANPESDRRRAKTIIDIGSAFALWQKFRDENGFKTDTELAFYLLSRTACCADLSALRKKRKLEPLTDVPTHLKMEECESDSSQPSKDHQCTKEDEDMEVPEICYEVPPPYQTDEAAEIETRSKDQIKSESQIKLEDQSAAPALKNEDIVPESSTSVIKNEIKEEPVETEVQPENRLEVSMDSVTTSDKITPSLVQTVNPVAVAVKEEHTEEPLVPNKTNFTGLFRTCIQCGEPVQEYTTVSSGSLNQLQWKCSNGHLMCLFSNNNQHRHIHIQASLYKDECPLNKALL